MHSSPAIVESYHPGRRSGHARPAQGRPKTGSDRQIHGRKKKRWGRLLYRRRSIRRRSFPASSPVDGSAGVREGEGLGVSPSGRMTRKEKAEAAHEQGWEGETERATGFVRSDSSCWASGFVIIKSRTGDRRAAISG
jgi:hypothetical protein